MEADQPNGTFQKILRLHGNAHHPRRRMKHQPGEGHQRDGRQPQRPDVDQRRRLGVAPRPEDPGNVGDIK